MINSLHTLTSIRHTTHVYTHVYACEQFHASTLSVLAYIHLLYVVIALVFIKSAYSVSIMNVFAHDLHAQVDAGCNNQIKLAQGNSPSPHFHPCSS